jgi:antitoxin component YwqK of YwqJK toxin-antitoxin module
MKLKTILLSLFLLLSTPVLADNNENCLTSGDVEKRNGLYYLTGQDNPFTGTSKCVYSDTGQVKSLGEIWGGKRDGKYTLWYENGQKSAEGNYKDGRLDGKSAVWSGGQKWKEENYKDGKLIVGNKDIQKASVNNEYVDYTLEETLQLIFYIGISLLLGLLIAAIYIWKKITKGKPRKF